MQRPRANVTTLPCGSRLTVLLAMLLIVFSTGAARADDAVPAPDESAYPHKSWRTLAIGPNNDSGNIWLFVPDEPAATGPTPVVMFMHGWGALQAGFYGDWIKHLVRRGNIVLYPRHQTSVYRMTSRTDDIINRSLAALLYSLAQKSPHAYPDWNRFTMIGHSTGAIVGPNYFASERPDNPIPQPRGMFLVNPGNSYISIHDMSRIKDTTFVNVVASDMDHADAQHRTTRGVFNKFAHIPDDRKSYEIFPSPPGAADDPTLPRADHFFPCAPALDIARPFPGDPDPDLPPLKRIGMLVPDRLTTDRLDYKLWEMFDRFQDKVTVSVLTPGDPSSSPEEPAKTETPDENGTP